MFSLAQIGRTSRLRIRLAPLPALVKLGYKGGRRKLPIMVVNECLRR
jgi:hypothetical protein